MVCAPVRLPPGLVQHTVVDNASKLPGMVFRIPRRAPDAGDAEFATTTCLVVVWTQHPAPSVRAAFIGGPSMRFRMADRSLYLSLGMSSATHPVRGGKSCGIGGGCQVTTCGSSFRAAQSTLKALHAAVVDTW